MKLLIQRLLDAEDSPVKVNLLQRHFAVQQEIETYLAHHAREQIAALENRRDELEKKGRDAEHTAALLQREIGSQTSWVNRIVEQLNHENVRLSAIVASHPSNRSRFPLEVDIAAWLAQKTEAQASVDQLRSELGGVQASRRTAEDDLAVARNHINSIFQELVSIGEKIKQLRS
jgi:chromosome segregation ATPase